MTAAILVSCSGNSAEGQGNSAGSNQEEAGQRTDFRSSLEKDFEAITGETVFGVFCEDFSGEGYSSAFVFADKRPDEDSGAAFQGSLWYMEGKDCILLEEHIEAYNYEPVVLEYEKEKHLLYTENSAFPGSAISYIWAVKDHAPKLLLETQNYCFLDNGQLAIVRTLTTDSTNGRIWQRYYLYWDDERQSYKEYTGRAITEEEYLSYENSQEMKDRLQATLEEIIREACKEEITKVETSYIKRENGIININYSFFCGGNIYYYYARLTESNGKILLETPESYNIYEKGYITKQGGFGF